MVENPLDLITTTKENDLILDSMAESGTTGVSCLKHYCRFIGIERNPETFKIMQSRLSKILIENDYLSIKKG